MSFISPDLEFEMFDSKEEISNRDIEEVAEHNDGIYAKVTLAVLDIGDILLRET